MSPGQDYFEAGKVNEISNGQMKHVDKRKRNTNNQC
jgi:hypothetical protein